MILLLTSAADAERKWGWGGFAIGMGGPVAIHGDLKERMGERDCCMMTGRIVFGGGWGRWGGELQLVAAPMTDTFSTDDRDRQRSALLWGPMVRYAVLQKWGLSLAVRGGVQHGTVSGDGVEMQDVGCDGPCKTTTTYEPPKYGMWSATIGATAQARKRVERGYFGVWADVDYTVARVSYPDRGVTGAMTSRTYGFTFGSWFD